LVAVEVAECDQCGWRAVDMDNSAILDAAYDLLKSGDTTGLTPVGTVYRQV
jgi:hypothetical protein